MEFVVKDDMLSELKKSVRVHVPCTVSRCYTVIIDRDIRDVDDFEVVLRGVSREYGARVFERTLNELKS
jgi:hypothetical protein